MIVDSVSEEVSINEITELLKSKHVSYKSNNLKLYLDELTGSDRDEVLRYHKVTNSYHFSNPFFKSYVAAKKFEESNQGNLSKKRIVEKMNGYLENINLAKMQFLKEFDEFSEDFYDDYEDTDEI